MSLREAALEDFHVFRTEVLKNPFHEEPHREMESFISDLGEPKKMMLVPRDTWKTSISGTDFPLWMWCRAWFLHGNPIYRSLIDTETMTLSRLILGAIKRIVQHHGTFRTVFGDLYVKKGDKGDELSLKPRINASTSIKEPNFKASSVESSKTGVHADLIHCDDIVGENNVGTLGERERVWRHFRALQAIHNADKGSLFHLIGTRWDDDDIYGRLLAQEEKEIAEGKRPEWATMIRSAHMPDGTLFAPTLLPEEVLQDRMRTMEGMYWAQYENDPNKHNAPFKREQLVFKDLDEFPGLYLRRLTIDPAVKREQVEHGDYACFIAGGIDRWKRPHVMDVTLRNDLTAGDHIDETMRLAIRWQIHEAVIEQVHYDGMDILLRDQMARRGYFFPVRYVQRSRMMGKASRWRNIQAYAQQNPIVIAKQISTRAKAELVEQWTRAPHGRHDDFMDALELQTAHVPIGNLTDDDMETMDAKEPMQVLAQSHELLRGKAVTLADFFGHVKAIELARRHREAALKGEEPDEVFEPPRQSGPLVCEDNQDYLEAVKLTGGEP